MPPPEQNASASRLQTPIGERDYTTGPPDAPVTLLEYGDYECPYSRKGYQIAHRLLQMEAPALRFAFRQFPLTNIHPHAESAAEAALAAGAQGHFWEMSSRLFEHQDALERADLRRHAEQLGLDADAVDEALRTERTEERRRQDARVLRQRQALRRPASPQGASGRPPARRGHVRKRRPQPGGPTR